MSDVTPYEFVSWFRPTQPIERVYGYDDLLTLVVGQDNVLMYSQTGDYQGDWVAVITDGERIGIVDGYFGSCGGCDALESARDDRRPNALVELAEEYLRSVRTFPSWEAVLEYLDSSDHDPWAFRGERGALRALAEVRMPLAARHILATLLADGHVTDVPTAARMAADLL